jgi:hypothetical protein
VSVSNLELRLPVLETPGSLGGLVQSPAAKVVPAGYELAADYLTGPPGDADGDGVPDAQDDCPNAPGPSSNQGCPTIGADDDKDGIPNSQDRCRGVAGVVSNGGCPAAKSCRQVRLATRGTARRDVLIGTSASDRLIGRGGADRLVGKRGADCLSGGKGRDRLSGGPGRDRLSGGRGADRILAKGGKRDVVRCGPGFDRAKVDRRDVVRGCERTNRRRG